MVEYKDNFRLWLYNSKYNLNGELNKTKKCCMNCRHYAPNPLYAYEGICFNGAEFDEVNEWDGEACDDFNRITEEERAERDKRLEESIEEQIRAENELHKQRKAGLIKDKLTMKHRKME